MMQKWLLILLFAISPLIADGVRQLELPYVEGGDYILAQPITEENLITLITEHPLIEKINLSGQPFITEAVMMAIQTTLPNLKQLKIRGSIRLHGLDGAADAWETINWQKIPPSLVEQLVGDYSPLQLVDFSLSTIDDTGLLTLAKGAPGLRALSLRGVPAITDTGLLTAIDQLPDLQILELGRVILRKSGLNEEIIDPALSKSAIKTLKDRGILVFQQDRVPRF